MKGLAITIVIACCATQLKAQQTQALKLDSLNKPGANVAVPLNKLLNVNTYNMPIVRMQGNSKMPVVQTDASAYNMPVVGMNKPGVYNMTKPNEEKPVAPANNIDVK